MDDTVHPQPQFMRSTWSSLDGAWEYAFNETTRPDAVAWGGEILVPFPPEASLSGVGDTAYHPVVWYRRSFAVPDAWREGRLLLHFGAVDYLAEVWVNGRLVARHEGGHTPFTADIADVLVEGEQEVVVRAADDPLDMAKPRGKQDWKPEPHGIWYPRTSGIWQHVWLEPVAATRLTRVRLTPDVDDLSVRVDAEVEGPRDDVRLEVTFEHEGETLASDGWALLGSGSRTVHLPRRWFGDLDRFLWSPNHPTLIDVRLVLRRGDEVLDEVSSYTALRSVEAKGGTFLLNGRPYFLRLALDQGYWDDGLLAAPDDDALRRDVELAKAMGFNGVRKHQKIEDPRYLYWADRLGLLVWEEMPSPYDFTPDAVGRLAREWLEVIERDYNHPCIVAWVCFNESWGVPDLPRDARQRHFVEGLYHLTKALDATRPVVGNDGWEHVATDLLTIHDYAHAPAVLSRRYGSADASRTANGEIIEHGRTLVVGDPVRGGGLPGGEPVVLSEFGGVRFHPGSEGWGYQQVESAEAFIDLYGALVAALPVGALAGFCYTQFADTFQEQNGLLYSDRRPKVALEALALATRGGG